MQTKKIKLPTLECLRCGHTWIPRIKNYPKHCPKCISPYWDRPRGTPATHTTQGISHATLSMTKEQRIRQLEKENESLRKQLAKRKSKE